MKKIVYLLVALCCAGTACACMKKSMQPSTFSTQPLTVIVMDTTQALLPDAQVKVGKSVYTTSFDGRVVLQPEQWNGVRKLSVSCEGYEARKVQVNGTLLMVQLTPKRAKESRGVCGGKVVLTRTARADVFYSLKAAPASAAMEGAVMAEEADYTVVGYGGVANQVAAGRLTAGEVNDFTKWYLWPSILDGTHQSYVQDWRMAPRFRYTVQVTNADGFPVAARAVSLLDAQGNTLFQAVTDNTGKAELWHALIGNGEQIAANGLQIRVDDQVQAAMAWSEGMNRFVLNEPCEAPENVDVVFVFDATGSMGDELRYLQEEMKDVIARAKEATGGLAIRTGAVVYRDHGDEYITRISRLTDDISVTQTFIDKQEANGGGDFPEAIPEALMAALNSAGWDNDARARIAFLVLDAPCHNDSATLALVHEQVLNAAALGVRIVPVVCSGLDKSGELLLRSIALATNGTSFFLTDDSGIGQAHLKPTTDTLKVEHLNDMLVRTIVEFSAMPDCLNEQMVHDEIVNDFIPNPFDAKELESNPSIPHGEGVHYLLDVSGKLLGIYEGDIDQLSITTDQLPKGIYFIKTYINGQWFTKKILVR